MVSSTSFGGGRKLGKIKLISSYKTKRALQAGTAKLILILEGQKNLLESILMLSTKYGDSKGLNDSDLLKLA